MDHISSELTLLFFSFQPDNEISSDCNHVSIALFYSVSNNGICALDPLLTSSILHSLVVFKRH